MAKSRPLKRILGYVMPYWAHLLLNVFFNLVTIFFSLFSFALLVPFLNLLFQSEVVEVVAKPEFSLTSDYLMGYLNYYMSNLIHDHGQRYALIFICIVLLVAFFFRNLGRFFAYYSMAKVRVGTIKDLRNDLYNKILILPLSFYHKQKKGDIMSRITTDVQEVETSILNWLEVLIKDPLTIIFYFAFLLSQSTKLTLFVLVLLPIAGLLIGRIGKALKKQSKETQGRLAGITSTIEETISGLRIIKGFNAIGYLERKFGEQNKTYSKSLLGVHRKRDMSSPLSEFLSAIVVIIVLWFGSNMILDGDNSLSAAGFISYVVVFSQIISPIKSFAQGYFNIKKGAASADRIFEILDAEEVITEKDNALEVKDFNTKIQYQDVTFRYGKDDVLKDINLIINKGKVIALVGESGGGKSTLVDLLPRFYDVCEGQIMIDGHDIRDYKISDLRGLMGIVTQESILFNDTVFNNIAFGMEDVSKEAVEEAAKVANAHEFIMEMEHGYDTYIGDRGMNLSGGQRQRLSIARAVLKNPPILILDEATSSLDTESERLVQDALSKVMSQRTSIVIAHRLSTIQHADEIIVMQKGQIIERGTHEQLIALNGVYKKLTDLQSFN
ncbi:MAG: ATP-binding cassette domain-containing protein [Bacteroidales bacterium]|nr:ATP-binding cassette domain-containing protein [Bacteroidales bacterium]